MYLKLSNDEYKKIYGNISKICTILGSNSSLHLYTFSDIWMNIVGKFGKNATTFSGSPDTFVKC